MDIILLLMWNSAVGVVIQTCNEMKVHTAVHQRAYLEDSLISCISGVSLEQCALECLLVAMCASISYKEERKTNLTVCEMNSGNDVFKKVFDSGYDYVDIRDWPQDVAGTCASRPCAEHQHCIPTRPYRCMDIDCGIPPLMGSDFEYDGNLLPLPKQATLGFEASYKCRDPSKGFRHKLSSSFRCYHYHVRICSSDSTWTQNDNICK